jgi:hypothetical protein
MCSGAVNNARDIEPGGRPDYFVWSSLFVVVSVAESKGALAYLDPGLTIDNEIRKAAAAFLRRSARAKNNADADRILEQTIVRLREITTPRELDQLGDLARVLEQDDSGLAAQAQVSLFVMNWALSQGSAPQIDRALLADVVRHLHLREALLDRISRHRAIATEASLPNWIELVTEAVTRVAFHRIRAAIHNSSGSDQRAYSVWLGEQARQLGIPPKVVLAEVESS